MKTLGYILLGALVLPALPFLMLGFGLYVYGALACDAWHAS